MSYRALVTGAAGFVGRRLARHLRERGWEVVGADRGEGDYFDCDITRPERVKALLGSAGTLTHVFHLAAQTFVPDSIRTPAASFNVNVNGTINLLHGLREVKSPARFLFVASGEVYGPPRYLPIDEEHALEPRNPYAISKCAADHYCRYYAAATGMPVIVVRPFNHTGGGQSPDFVLPSFARQVAAIEAGLAEPVIRVGNLNARRDFSHVDDVVRAYRMLAESGVPGEAYNVCSGQARRVGDALDYLVERAHEEVRIEPDPARMRPVDVPEVAGSHEKLSAVTGWQAEHTFESVLDELLDYWRGKVREDAESFR
ncbi:MAG: NAD-dependent epimerase/dehydratase family protein [Candidatus Hydrogenedens sp.]|nr:NAD-dependent epimerase/dehydratase family protein [Candidatus Hydrogenedens sp.]